MRMAMYLMNCNESCSIPVVYPRERASSRQGAMSSVYPLSTCKSALGRACPRALGGVACVLMGRFCGCAGVRVLWVRGCESFVGAQVWGFCGCAGVRVLWVRGFEGFVGARV